MNFSVHTNTGAMTVLMALQDTSRETQTTQRRISTGLRVSGVKDSNTDWAIAQRLRAANSSRGAAMTSVNFASGVVAVALAATEGISDLMGEMKSKLLAATDKSLDESSWRAIMGEFIVLANEIKNLTDSAEFNGINLLDAGASNISVLVSDNPSVSITINAEDLTDGGGILDVGLPGVIPYADDSVVTTQPTAAMVAAFETSTNDVNAAMSRLGVELNGLDVYKDLLSQQVDITDRSIGSLVDADLAAESAKLEALNVRQQLGAQSLALANQMPQMMLSFFR